MSSDEKLKDSKWARSTVRKILTDIAYIGHRVHGRKQKETFYLPKKATDSDKWIIIENAHPAIVPSDLFYVVQGINDWQKEYRPCQFAVSKLQKKLLKHWLKELSLAWSMHTPLSINLILGSNIP